MTVSQLFTMPADHSEMGSDTFSIPNEVRPHFAGVC